MVDVALSPLGGAGWQFLDDNGRILSGGRLYSYEAGTTTPLATYADSSGNVSNGPYVQLDSAGRPPSEIWQEFTKNYKYELKASTGSSIRTYDQIPGIAGSPYVSQFINNLASSAGSGLVGFSHAETYSRGTIGEKGKHIPSVTDAPFNAGSTSNDTAAFTAIAAQYLEFYVPEGTYNVDQIVLSRTGAAMHTAGLSTIIQQRSGRPDGTPIIQVTGSNVTIGDLTLKGNIATDGSEFNHAININTNTISASIARVTIGDINAQNIRGDVLSISARTGYSVSGIKAGRIYGNNIYRNVVAITGGSNISIVSITGDAVGYMHLDIEPEAAYTPVSGVRVGYVKGRYCSNSSASATNFIDGVTIDYLDLDPSYTTGSTPSYAPGASLIDALQFRNAKSIRIGKFKANGFNGQALKQIYNSGELSSQSVQIGEAEFTDCCKTESTYSTYILGSVNISKIEIARVKASITRTGVSLIRGCSGAVIGQTEVALSASTQLSLACDDATFGPLNVTGAAGVLTQSSKRVTFRGGAASTAYAASSSNACIFQDIVLTTATGDFAGGASYQDHWFYNVTLNTSYYGSGPYSRAYTQAIRFGANWLWVDSTGVLRIKATTAPSSDTDGTVVGTQT